ncbi:hypothetical protein [Nocardia grenadensis]|uniref:hypothetical protein n=1 Tax=Nocardia grenadensis TaxID=931537 RepID=UPI003D8B51F1
MTEHWRALPPLVGIIALTIGIVEVSRSTKNTFVILLAVAAVIALVTELSRHILHTYRRSREQ